MKFLFCLLLTLSITKFCFAVDRQSVKDVVDRECRFNKGKCVRVEKLMTAVKQASQKFSVPRSRLLAIIKVESKFQERAYYLGNHGLMQVNAFWHKTKFKTGDLFNVGENVLVGASIIGYCQKRHKQLKTALGKCYNGGMDKKYYDKVSAAETEFRRIGVDEGDGPQK